MLCDKCQKNQAVTHIKTVINGIVYEKHLCEDCAKEEGVNDSFTNPFSQLFDSLFGAAPQINSSAKKCKICGASLNQILSTGKFGCSDCYQTFKDELSPYIKKMQGSDKYLGKGYKSRKAKAEEQSPDKHDELTNLQEELKRAVAEERFEDAAGLRDKINGMKEGK